MTQVAVWMRERTWVTQAAVLLTANLLLVVCAQLSFRLPFSPVPITAQTFAVVMVGMVLGSRWGTAVVAAYLMQGMVGLPVFAEFGNGLRFLGPTGGYLIGFLPAVYLAGLLWERAPKKTLLIGFFVALAAEAAVFAVGLLWLAVFVGFSGAVAVGLLPFLPGTLIKCAAAAALARSMARA